MSELLEKPNSKISKLKSLILRLHEGEDKDLIKAEFINEFKYVAGAEIAQMEQQLVNEGMKVEEIMNLCDIHASLFQDNLENIHSDRVDHPFDYFRDDNHLIEELLKDHDQVEESYIRRLYQKLDEHYNKKEQLLFPLLEHVNILTVPQVMWGVDNEIREELKGIIKALSNKEEVTEAYELTKQKILDMIVKENKVLYQMLEEHLTSELWDKLAVALEEDLQLNLNTNQATQELLDGYVTLPSGKLAVNELEKLLNVLPLDITFVNKEDRVAYVSQGKHRIFDRPLTVLGREVRLCHPPQSVDIVNEILKDFKAKRKDHEAFWINFKGMFVYIQYFAIYDNDNEYLGVIEVTQDISEIQAITGEKRLRDM